MYRVYYNNYLEHHGVIGQKWGVREARRQYDRQSIKAYRRSKKFNKKANKASRKAYQKSLLAKGWEGPIDIHTELETGSGKVPIDIGTHKNVSTRKQAKYETKAEKFLNKSYEFNRRLDALDKNQMRRGEAIIKQRKWTAGLLATTLATGMVGAGAVGAGAYTAIRYKKFAENRKVLNETKKIRDNKIRGTT